MTKRFSWSQVAKLGAESARVISLRLQKLGRGGPAAHFEAQRMVAEKVTANISAMGTLMMGGSLSKVVSGYRKKVRSNRRRLSKP